MISLVLKALAVDCESFLLSNSYVQLGVNFLKDCVPLGEQVFFLKESPRGDTIFIKVLKGTFRNSPMKDEF
tara:strand:- start:316 stop:528 length:213 start_codon:yes stop_codon:yes gene_type:complete